ncbi:T9SS type A sorting domain-containing protein [Flavihumibacter sp. R14]|nr:T9SS type A sorting domain-containing protein [Flavihumibacter soli]
MLDGVKIAIYEQLTLPMRIFTRLFSLFFIYSISAIAAPVPKTFTGTGNWSLASNWSPVGVPTSVDPVTIKSGSTVIMDMVSATCASIDFESSSQKSSNLTISGTNTLNVVGNLNITDGKPDNVLAVGGGTINIGGNVLISGNGNGQQGELTVSSGTVNVAGDFGFTWTGPGNYDTRLIDVTGTGSILVSGQFTNPGAGTITPGSLDNIYINASYFRTTNTGSWNSISTWQISWDNVTFHSANIVPNGAALKITIMQAHIVAGMPALALPKAATILDVSGTLDCGVNQISGLGAFNLNSGGTLITSHPSGIGPGGSIALTGNRTFSSAANYEFRGANTGLFTTSPTAQTCNNLTINNASGVSLSMPIAVNGTLNITGKLNIGSNILTLNGSIGGTNATNGLVGSANSELVIGGTGNLNLGFNQASADTRTLKNYTQSRNATVTLVESLQVLSLLKLTGTNAVLASGSNAYLRLLSTSTSFANVASLPANASITGEVKVESWITGGSASNSVSSNANRGTRTLSSPINDLTSLVPVYKQLKNYMFITGSGDSEFDNNGSSATLLTYKESAKYADGAAGQYTPITSLSTRLTNGQGFFLYFRGSRTPSLGKLTPLSGSTYATPESFAITYQGQINQGTLLPINLSYTVNTGLNDGAYNGFNLIGNPYPATIDWAKVTRTANVDNMVSIIKPGGGMTTYSGGYVVNGGTAALPAGAAVPVNTPSTSFYIQPGQGFYVRARAAGQTITFTEAAKAVSLPDGTITSPARLLNIPLSTIDGTSNRISSLGSNAVYEDLPKAIYFELSDKNNKEETAIVFNEGNDPGYGANDATYFAGSTVALSTLTVDDQNVAINFMPGLEDISEIRLVVGSSVSGPVKLKFTDLKAAGKFRVFLQDNFLDRKIDVKANPEYSFDIDKSNQLSYGANRFKILFLPPLPPPVEIADFDIKLKNNASNLNWVTKRESNNDRFEIERSSDGKTFTSIGQVKGAMNSQILLSYSYLDKQPLTGTNYYRLKQIDIKGDFEYSETLMINYDINKPQNFKNAMQIEVYPNPASDEIHVNLQTSQNNKLLITIFKATGEKVKQVESNPGKIATADLINLTTGLYILEVSDAKTKEIIGRAKFFKN